MDLATVSASNVSFKCQYDTILSRSLIDLRLMQLNSDRPQALQGARMTNGSLDPLPVSIAFRVMRVNPDPTQINSE